MGRKRKGRIAENMRYNAGNMFVVCSNVIKFKIKSSNITRILREDGGKNVKSVGGSTRWSRGFILPYGPGLSATEMYICKRER